MKVFACVLILIAATMACSGSKTDSKKDCLPIIDRAVAKMQKFAYDLDTVDLDSALEFYDEAVTCDSSRLHEHMSKVVLGSMGRYRESLTIIDNVYKVRDIPTSKDAHFWMIKGWLFEKMGEKDSSIRCIERARTTAKLPKGS